MILQFFKWKLDFETFSMKYSLFCIFFPQDSPESDAEREKDKKERERDSEKERARQRSESKHKSPTKKRPGKDSVSSASFFPSCLGSGKGQRLDFLMILIIPKFGFWGFLSDTEQPALAQCPC